MYKVGISLENFVKGYLEFLETDLGRKWDAERKEKKELFRETFSRELLSSEKKTREFERKFREVLESLWALELWRNKHAHIEVIIKKNGISVIRREFKNLMYGEGNFAKRFDNSRKRLWGLGVSSITEILCFARPTEFIIWNDKVVKALERLDLMKELYPSIRGKKNPIDINGEQYLHLLDFFSKLRDELAKYLGKLDYSDLDYFLFYVASIDRGESALAEVEEDISASEEIIIKNHKEAQYYLLEIGNLLGYTTYVAKSDRGKKVGSKTLGEVASIEKLPEWLMMKPSSNDPEEVDVLWFDSSGDDLRYAFEVSHTSDMRKDLAVLVGMSGITSKLFIVAPEKRRPRFKDLIEGKPFRKDRDRLGFISYKELIKLYKNLKELRKLLDSLGIRAEF